MRGNTIFLNIIVQENPQLASYGFANTVSRGEADKLRDEIQRQRGRAGERCGRSPMRPLCAATSWTRAS